MNERREQAPAAKKSTLMLVLEAVQDLHALEQVVTRETLADVTGLKLTTLDDRLALLVDSGEVVRVQRGVFVPASRHPPARPISRTVLPDGTVKVEIGDEIITLTPREDRSLAGMMSGAATQAAMIEAGRGAAQLAAELGAQVRRLRQKVAALSEQVDCRQGGLFEDAGPGD